LSSGIRVARAHVAIDIVADEENKLRRLGGDPVPDRLVFLLIRAGTENDPRQRLFLVKGRGRHGDGANGAVRRFRGRFAPPFRRNRRRPLLAGGQDEQAGDEQGNQDGETLHDTPRYNEKFLCKTRV